ncbi:uncharacterized protein BP5553_07312 [Venustampulla echinocandica]|uniref:DUF7730 domain-containing protein n=1 Tax=Venustampulla echinocandica TaxID=2656787 RepID=A0A370TJ43_9HELO|nr:uncharacterized protein BP5553_07312 [Venustampulla echinocandica]RDL35381.1 hypothetical protein BP5553_07312 [Venustampulla echinocandica]
MDRSWYKPGETARRPTGSRDIEGSQSLNDNLSSDRMTLCNNTLASPKNETHTPPQSLAVSRKAIFDMNQTTRLLKPPAEIRAMIFQYCVAHDSPICPVQLCHRSNKFRCASARDPPEEGRIDDRYRTVVASTPPPSIVALTMVCKQIYMEVAGEHLFYKNNLFYLESGCLFQFAITAARFHAIRSIACNWSHYCDPTNFRSIAICKSLQSLELYFVYYSDRLDHQISPYTVDTFTPNCLPILKLLVRGLKHLAVYPPRKDSHLGDDAQRQSKHNMAVEFCLGLENHLKAHMKGPRVITNAMLEAFKKIQIQSRLDIHGEGRLGEYLKPEVLSSRTRYQTRRAATINPDGTIPPKPWPKYSAEGALVWHVIGISDSRETMTDDGLSGVEFLVHHHSNKNHYSINQYPHTESEGVSWEDAAVLSSPSSLEGIIEFYGRNSMASGKEALVAFWKLQPTEVIKKAAKARFIAEIRRVIKFEKSVKAAEKRSMEIARF